MTHSISSYTSQRLVANQECTFVFQMRQGFREKLEYKYALMSAVGLPWYQFGRYVLPVPPLQLRVRASLR